MRSSNPCWYLLFLAIATAWPSLAVAQLSNPIPQPIVKENLRVRIQNIVQMPSTTGTLGSKVDNTPSARARINFLRESPDGRVWVNDLRGQLYSLGTNFQPQLFVDLDAANGGAGSIFPAMHFTDGLAAGFISFNFHPDFNHVGTYGYGKFYTIHLERAQDTAAVPNFATVDERSGSHPVNWHTVITEWTMPNPLANSWSPTTGTRRELLRVGTTADSYFHPYGDLQFNPVSHPGDPDYGLLYLSGGDWGYINGAGAPQGSPTEGQPGQLQRLDTLAGTMIRIDPRSPVQSGGQAGLGDYTIPPTNPFVDGNPNTLDEIYALGFRNGHRMAWDPDDGSLYVMNVGHANLEEIERVIPGGNYGWGLREGTFVNGNDRAHGGNGDADAVFANNVPDIQDVDFRGQEFLYPVVQYDHGEGQSIAGGFVYHGTQIPSLRGKFVFGDIVRGRLFAADLSQMRSVDITEPMTNVHVEEIQLYTVNASGLETNVDLSNLVGGSRTDLRFGQRPDGEIYVMTKTDGFIRQLVGDAHVPFGDYNRDGIVNAADYTVWRDTLGQSVVPGTRADGNGNGKIDQSDYDLWTMNFGHVAGAGAEDAIPVPEPSSLVLVSSLACVGLIRLIAKLFRR
jgi:Glucose / Sorbosone dehydrogenase/Dockerin type I domain